MILILIVRATIKEYMEIFDGSMEKALEQLGEDVKVESSEVVMELIDKPIAFGVKLNMFLSRDLSDQATLIHLTLKSLIRGDVVKKMFDKPIFIPAEQSENGIAKVVIGIKDCPLCCGLEDKLRPLVGNSDYFTVITALGQAAVQNVIDYIGLNYRVEVKETKCKCRGDEKGELTVYYYPRN